MFMRWLMLMITMIFLAQLIRYSVVERGSEDACARMFSKFPASC